MNESEKKELLDFAYDVLKGLFTGKRVDIPTCNESFGAFVTLRKKGSLRGCIGYMEPVAPLYQMIALLVKDAAFNDFRFPPLDESEVNDVSIEISLLTPLKRIGSLDDFILGRDGLIMSLNGRKAVFLPEVAIETGWDKKTFLEQLSLKAGLQSSAYLDPGAEFRIFQAEVIRDDL